MRERRERPRASFTGWVEITTLGRRRLATGRDLSPDGLGVIVRPPTPAVHSPVTSEFGLPGISLPLALEGTVVWSDPSSGQLGLRFDGVDSSLAELLESFLTGSP